MEERRRNSGDREHKICLRVAALFLAGWLDSDFSRMIDLIALNSSQVGYCVRAQSLGKAASGLGVRIG